MRLFHWLLILILCGKSCGGPVKDTATNSGLSNLPKDGDMLVPENTLLPVADSATIPNQKLIVPGKSIGLCSIDEKADSIGLKLGTPDEGDAAMGKAISTWRSKSNKAHSTTIYFTTNFGDKDEAKRAQQIRITSPYFSTKDKIGVGSSFEDIKKSFSSLIKTGSYPSPSDAKQSINVFDDAAAGIAFEIDPSNNCVGITIHKLGDKPFETYLNFLEGYKPVN